MCNKLHKQASNLLVKEYGSKQGIWIRILRLAHPLAPVPSLSIAPGADDPIRPDEPNGSLLNGMSAIETLR